MEEGNTVGGARFCGGDDKELKVTHVNLEVPGSWVVQAERECGQPGDTIQVQGQGLGWEEKCGSGQHFDGI